MSFGPHEYIPGIIHNNQSATIDCAEGSVVKAVYAGEVTAVMDIGGVKCVILRHGGYYTAYSNLATTAVAQGDQVQAGEPLGSVGEIGQLEFMLSDESGRFYDPEVWLKR
jgi:septal ring factor EnvC (AmiA/AmiB activator)